MSLITSLLFVNINFMEEDKILIKSLNELIEVYWTLFY